jgi:isoleucyl-tRNA synthetase
MKSKGCFKVLCGLHVTDDAGTGIVHTAPAFGVEDYQISREYSIIDPDNPCVCIDDSGYFLPIVSDFAGKKIKDTDKDII